MINPAGLRERAGPGRYRPGFRQSPGNRGAVASTFLGGLALVIPFRHV